ncbi:uncharacterized protein METZ01_LOCUS243920, partial [marine metagenome]
MPIPDGAKCVNKIIEFETDDHLAIITLNRPEVMNA